MEISIQAICCLASLSSGDLDGARGAARCRSMLHDRRALGTLRCRFGSCRVVREPTLAIVQTMPLSRREVVCNRALASQAQIPACQREVNIRAEMAETRPPFQDVSNVVAERSQDVVAKLDDVALAPVRPSGSDDGVDSSFAASDWSERDREHMARMFRAAVRQSTRCKAENAELLVVRVRWFSLPCLWLNGTQQHCQRHTTAAVIRDRVVLSEFGSPTCVLTPEHAGLTLCHARTQPAALRPS
jgi:hypothetical protein